MPFCISAKDSKTNGNDGGSREGSHRTELGRRNDVAHPSLPMYRMELESDDGEYLSLSPPYDHEMLVSFLLRNKRITVRKVYVGDVNELTGEEEK